MTDADRVMNAQHFWSDPADIELIGKYELEYWITFG